MLLKSNNLLKDLNIYLTETFPIGTCTSPSGTSHSQENGSPQVEVGDHIFRQHYLDSFLSRTFLSEILQTNKLENNKTVRIGTFVLRDGFPFNSVCPIRGFPT